VGDANAPLNDTIQFTYLVSHWAGYIPVALKSRPDCKSGSIRLNAVRACAVQVQQYSSVNKGLKVK